MEKFINIKELFRERKLGGVQKLRTGVIIISFVEYIFRNTSRQDTRLTTVLSGTDCLLFRPYLLQLEEQKVTFL
jgi:hypothetical protein